MSSESSLDISPESLHTLTASTSLAQHHETPDDLPAEAIISLSPTSQDKSTKVLRITWERLIINSLKAYDFLHNIIQPYVDHLPPPLASYFDVLSRHAVLQWTPTYRAFTRACIRLWHDMKSYISPLAYYAFLPGRSQLGYTVYTVVGHAQKASSSTSLAISKSNPSALVKAVLIKLVPMPLAGMTTPNISTAALAIFNPLAPDRDVLPSLFLQYFPPWTLPYIRVAISIYRFIKLMVILAFQHPHLAAVGLLQVPLLSFWMACLPCSRILWLCTGGAMLWLIKAGLRISWAVLKWCVGGIWRRATTRHAPAVPHRRHRF